MKKEVLRIENGSVEELRHIYMQLYAGEITGLVFEKVKEQNVFLKIMTGQSALSEGRIFFQEKNLVKGEDQKKIAEYTSVISKKSNIVSELSAEENLFLLDGEVKDIVVHKKEYKKRREEIFRELGYDCDFGRHVYGLNLYERLSLELIRAYILKKKIVVMTDIIGALEQRDREKIWNLIDRIKNQGTAFLMVGSIGDLEFERLQTVAIVKKNRTLISGTVNSKDYEKMFHILYGNSRKEYQNIENPEVIMNMKDAKHSGLRLGLGIDDRGNRIEINLSEGEIRELVWADDKEFDRQMKTVMECQFVNSYIEEDGRRIEGRRAKNWFSEKAGIIVEDPWEQMIFPSLSVLDNIFISVLKKYPAQYVKKRHRKSIIKMLEGILDKKYFDRLIEELEPHILQKIVYCRWMLLRPRLLICIRPMSEGNIKVREVTREMINLLAAQGVNVLCMTTDIEDPTFKDGKEIYLYKGESVTLERAREVVYRDKI